MDPWMVMYWGGRILFSAIFIMSGFNHLLQFKPMVQYAESQKIPLAKVAVIVTGLMMLTGGVMVFLWWHPLWGAGLIGTFLVAAALTMHNFWTVTDPAAKQDQMAHFMKNLSLAGAAALIGVLAHLGGYRGAF